jgi:hypothetical protein
VWQRKGLVIARPDGPSDTWARRSRVRNNTAEKRQHTCIPADHRVPYSTCPPGQPHAAPMHNPRATNGSAGTRISPYETAWTAPCTADPQPMHASYRSCQSLKPQPFCSNERTVVLTARLSLGLSFNHSCEFDIFIRPRDTHDA